MYYIKILSIFFFHLIPYIITYNHLDEESHVDSTFKIRDLQICFFKEIL